MIYNIQEEPLDDAYSVNGNNLSTAYNVGGSKIWEKDSSEPSEPSAPTILTVMTFNIGEFYGRNTTSVLSHIIDTYDADIIGLQEVYKTSLASAFSTVFSDYPYESFASQVNKTAIVSKTALSASSGIFSSQSIEQRGYNKAYFQFNGKSICWFNAHLETTGGGTAKASQARELYEMAIQEEYFIITGDFNTICRSTADEEYSTIMRQYLDYGCYSANCSEQFGFVNTWSGDNSLSSSNSYPCDHIITSPNLPIESVKFDMYKTTISSSYSIDHIPIIAEINVP